jgi:hypothetical protein
MQKIKLIALEHDCCAVCENFTEDCGGFCFLNCYKKNRSDCGNCKYNEKEYLVICPEIVNPNSTICEGNFKRRKE